MKEKPILFSTPMVQAILAGRKTMTRRIVKRPPVIDKDSGYKFYDNLMFDIHDTVLEEMYMPDHAPYRVGDIMWVRETWCIDERGKMSENDIPYYYRADMAGNDVWKGYWKPSIFMPRKACRIFLKVTNVRVERLQEISESDAINEGVAELEPGFSWVDYYPEQISYDLGMKRHSGIKNDYGCGSAKLSFCSLWTKINGKDSWAPNPWVWVYEFKQIERP